MPIMPEASGLGRWLRPGGHSDVGIAGAGAAGVNTDAAADNGGDGDARGIGAGVGIGIGIGIDGATRWNIPLPLKRPCPLGVELIDERSLALGGKPWVLLPVPKASK